MIVHLTMEQMYFITNETKQKLPLEACGLIFGEIEYDEVIVKNIVAVQNKLKSPTTFKVDPEELFKALMVAEKKGYELIGFYHSHPASPEPSDIDTRYMKLWPNYVWLVISSVNYNVKAYCVSNNSVHRVKIAVD